MLRSALTPILRQPPSSASSTCSMICISQTTAVGDHADPALLSFSQTTREAERTTRKNHALLQTAHVSCSSPSRPCMAIDLAAKKIHVRSPCPVCLVSAHTDPSLSFVGSCQQRLKDTSEGPQRSAWADPVGRGRCCSVCSAVGGSRGGSGGSVGSAIGGGRGDSAVGDGRGKSAVGGGLGESRGTLAAP
jgi:hypothetical protein